MSSVNYRPVNDAELLISSVFTQLEGSADAQIAELRYENQLRRFVEDERLRGGSYQTRGPGNFGRRPQSHMRPAFKLVAFVAALLLLGSWAGNIEIAGWDDGQQITVALPQGSQHDYMHWVALFANRSKELAAFGGQSLIVDYVPVPEGGYNLQLSVLGVDCSTANEWFRSVQAKTPELHGASYAITQPQVSYAVTVKEMLAYALGRPDAIERRVVSAWTLCNEPPTRNGVIYLITGEHDPTRASMLR